MGKDLWEESQAVREFFELASDVIGMDCTKKLFESSEEELKATNRAQVSIALVNKAAATVLAEHGISSDGCAGFSLGELSALNDAGVISDMELFRFTKIRGELMEQASRKLDSPGGRCGMAAVIGLEIADVVSVLDRMRTEDPSLVAYPGLHNGTSQIVISGRAEALARAEALFSEAGALRYVVLKTSGPFHSPLMEEARVVLQAELESYDFRDPIKALYSNVTGEKIATGEEAKELCSRQIVSTVRWVDVQASILRDGYDICLEVGPGTVLGGLWKRFQKGLKCRPCGTLDEIKSAKEAERDGG